MRVVNRPLAFILAAALLAVSVVVIGEVIGFAVHHSPLLVHWTTWNNWARVTHWNPSSSGCGPWSSWSSGWCWSPWSSSPAARPGCRWGPRPGHRRRRDPARPGPDAAGGGGPGVDGITGAAVRVRRGRARVTAASGARGRPRPTALTESLTQALGARLDGLEDAARSPAPGPRRPPEQLMHADRPEPRDADPGRAAPPARRRGRVWPRPRRLRRALRPPHAAGQPGQRLRRPPRRLAVARCRGGAAC